MARLTYGQVVRNDAVLVERLSMIHYLVNLPVLAERARETSNELEGFLVGLRDDVFLAL